MLTRLLSNDFPRSRILAVLLVRCCWRWRFTPFLFPGVKALNVAAKVLVFIVLVASFDLLLGYTGIVSFAHTMFFGIGAYGVAIASRAWARAGARWLVGIAGGAGAVVRAGAGHRPVLAAGAGDLLLDDHAGLRRGLPDAGLAAVGLHRRRGRPDLQDARGAVAQLRASRPPSSA
jgi:hypothetical protein